MPYNDRTTIEGIRVLVRVRWVVIICITTPKMDVRIRLDALWYASALFSFGTTPLHSFALSHGTIGTC
jgi:hypothetical protein